MRTKAQGPPSTAKAERAHRVLTLHTSKSIALIQMDVGHQKIGRKILYLHGWKARPEHTTPEEISITQEVVIQIEAEAGAETQIDLCIICFTREIQTIRQGTAPSF
jgi:hypothetical protein